jgi:hypothetical protein
MRKPVAAHEPSIKKRPSFQLLMGFAVKIIYTFFGKHLLYLHYLILGAFISASMNCFGNKEPRSTPIKANANLVAAHDPSLKGRPSFALFACFALKIAFNNTKLSRILTPYLPAN